MKKIWRLPFHVLLFAIYPALALMSANVSQIDLWLVWRPLIVSLLFAGILFLTIAMIIKPVQKAAIASTFALVIFFLYGHVHQLLLNSDGPLFTLSHHKILGVIFIVILLAGEFLIFRSRSDFKPATPGINLVALALVIMALIPVASYFIRLDQGKNRAAADTRQEISFSGTEAEKPDIYYIILDSYTRADALQRDFEYDNSPFLDELKSIGFSIGNCSRSNYGFTELAMSSTLNLNYLSAVNDQMKPGNSDLTLATALIQNNAVRRQLEGLGYKTIGFETGYAWNQWKDADLYITPNTDMSLFAPIRPFEEMFLRTTAYRLIADTNKQLRAGLVARLLPHHEQHVARVMTMLTWLGEKLPSVEGPKFVYAHINVPHVPFIFNPDGSLAEDPNYYRGPQDYPVSEEYFQQGYVNQVQFLNNRVPGIVKNIIQNSSRPVIIILQGDHGFMGDNRMDILNAVYFPGGVVALESSATPVNTFRLIFETYFSGQFPLLENASYLSTSEQPYDLTLIPPEDKGCDN